MCDIDDDDGEHSSVWCETPRKARKSHTCDCCGGFVSPGEKYLVHFSVYDGSPTSEKICGLCDAARDAFAKLHGGMSGSPGYFTEMLHDCIAEGDEESEKLWKPMLEEINGRRGQRTSTPSQSAV